jgi:hypothetical protein
MELGFRKNEVDQIFAATLMALAGPACSHRPAK